MGNLYTGMQVKI